MVIENITGIERGSHHEETSQPFVADSFTRLYNASCRNMAALEAESVQMVCTSPPYWGLREYSGGQNDIWGGDQDCCHEWQTENIDKEIRTGKGLAEWSVKYADGGGHKAGKVPTIHIVRATCSKCGAWYGAFGQEPTPQMYVEHTIEILREVRRVLRSDGVVFWNIGDTYLSPAGGYASGQSHGTTSVLSERHRHAVIKGKRIARGYGRWSGGGNGAPHGLKAKQLALIPFRVAIAAQDDGWWVRSVIVWSKTNPMPESVIDRPSRSHEYILQLTKSPRYYWDKEAVRQPQTGTAHSRGSEACNDDYARQRGSWFGFRSPDTIVPGGRNIRTVWEFPTQQFKDAHFAVFPEKLPSTCIQAATPEGGACVLCGKPFKRIVEKIVTKKRDKTDKEKYPIKDDGRYGLARRFTHHAEVNRRTIGWEPQCKCGAGSMPSLVLDPFAGASTTLLAAKKLGRVGVGYELSREYCEISAKRISICF